jgi:hypothetical protein
LFTLTGVAIDRQATRLMAKFQLAMGLARLKNLLQDPEHRPGFVKLGYSSLEDVCRHIGLDKNAAYELVRNVEVLGEAAYRAATRAGLTRDEYRAVRSLPKSELEEAKKILEEAKAQPVDKVKGAVKALLDAYSDEKERADKAEQLEKRAKTEQQKQKELAVSRGEKVNELQRDVNRYRKAAVDILNTSIGERAMGLIVRAMDLADTLKRRNYSPEDRELLYRTGGRVSQACNTVMDAFTQAMGGLEGMPKGRPLDAAVADADADGGQWLPAGVTERPAMGAFDRLPVAENDHRDTEEPTADGDASNV